MEKYKILLIQQKSSVKKEFSSQHASVCKEKLTNNRKLYSI